VIENVQRIWDQTHDSLIRSSVSYHQTIANYNQIPVTIYTIGAGGKARGGYAPPRFSNFSVFLFIDPPPSNALTHPVPLQIGGAALGPWGGGEWVHPLFISLSLL